VFISDADGNFIEFNDAFATFHRFRNKDECWKAFARYSEIFEGFLPDGEPAPPDMWPVKRALRGEIGANAELNVRRKDTGEGWVASYSFSPIRDKDGHIVGSVTVARDITEQKRAEEALRESEARLRRFYESGLVGVMYWKMDGKIRDANDKFLEMVGYTREELTAGKIDWLNMTPAEYRHLDERSVVELKATGVNKAPFEKEYIRKDGALIPIIIASAMLDEARFNGVAFVLDITEQKRMEEELRRSRDELELRVHERTAELRQALESIDKERQRLYDVLETLPVMICLLTPDYHVPFANRAFREKFGEARGRQCFDYCFGQKEPCEFCESFKVFQTKVPYHWEVKTPDGHVLDVYDYPFTDVDRSPLILEMDIDITEQRRAEDALTLASAYNRNLIEASIDPLVTIDREGRISDVNAATEQVTGCSRTDLIGSDFSNYFTEPEKARDGYRRVFSEGLVRDYPLEIRRDEGHTTPVLYNASVYRDEAGQVVGVFAAARDMTDLRQVESQLRQAQKVEALGTLSGGIAHDFNNILAAIIGFTELVTDHVPQGSREAHHLERVMEASLRGRELVRQMLTFSRKTEQEKKPLRVSSIVKETVRLIRAATPTTIGIRVDTLTESDLIFGDPTQIQQVLMNLCTNATYAMREKGGNLDIGLDAFIASPSNGDLHGIKPGLYVRLTVRDTGIGMPPWIMDKIFDPFFTTKKLGEGSGLGLSVVHGIVKQHDGYITVESEPDKGSAFTVYFPQVTGELETDEVSDAELPTGSERVLFIDDEEALVEMGEDILAELGYDVTSRMNGREALALFKADPSRFDLVITDQTMPEMTGVELAKAILALRPDMPVIMCTGFSYAVDADKAKAAGIKAFAMKPLTKREIARTIRQVLDE
jgi:PAS domain S-box-containing protein